MAPNLGREAVPWAEDTWDHINAVVHDEMKRICVARRFLPIVPLADALTVPADTIDTLGRTLSINEAAVTPLVEIWVEFALTKQQVEDEARLGTAVTLATRAANLLAQGEDLLLYRGEPAALQEPLFAAGRINRRAGPGPHGLSAEADLADPDPETGQVVHVQFSEEGGGRYGENTFTAVSDAYARLQGRGHYGPYALTLQTVAYADTYAPLRTTLIMPADRIRPLVDGRLYGTGTLPVATGVLLSTGGNSGDLVIGRDAITAFVQQDTEGLWRFRVFERFAHRDKDNTARILLTFAQA